MGHNPTCFLGHVGLDQTGSELEGGNVCPTLILYISPWLLGIALGASLCSARRLLGTMAQTHGALFADLITEGAMPLVPRLP